MARSNALGVTLVLSMLLAPCAAQEGPLQREQLHAFEVHRGNVTAAAFAPSGDALACGGTSGIVMVFEMPSQRLRWRARPRVASAPQPWIRSVSFSPDGRFVASIGNDLTIRRADSGLAVFQARDVAQAGFDWSDDGERIVYARGNRVFVHRLGDRGEDKLWGEAETVITSLGLFRDGSVFVGDRIGSVWRLPAGDRRATFVRDHQLGQRELVRMVAVASHDGVRYEVPSRGALLRGTATFAPPGETFAFAVGDDGRAFAAGGEDPAPASSDDVVLPAMHNTVRCWRHGGEQVQDFTVPGRIAVLAFHPNGEDLFVSTFLGHQGIYRRGKLLARTPGMPAAVTAIRLSADGTSIAVHANRWAVHSLDDRFVRRLDRALAVQAGTREAQFVVQERDRAVLLDGRTGAELAVYAAGEPFTSLDLPALPGPGGLTMVDRELRDRADTVAAELPPEFWAGTLGDLAHGSDGSWAVAGTSGSLANWGGLLLTDRRGQTRKVIAGVPVFSVAFSPDAARLYYIYGKDPGLGRRIRPTDLGVLDTRSCKVIASQRIRHAHWRFLDGRHALVCGHGELAVLDVESLRRIQSIELPHRVDHFELSVEHGLLVTHSATEVQVHRIRFTPE